VTKEKIIKDQWYFAPDEIPPDGLDVLVVMQNEYEQWFEIGHIASGYWMFEASTNLIETFNCAWKLPSYPTEK